MMAGVHHALSRQQFRLLAHHDHRSVSTLRTVMRDNGMEMPVSYICLSIPSPTAATKINALKLCDKGVKSLSAVAIVRANHKCQASGCHAVGKQVGAVQ